MAFVVVYDACVLYPNVVRDLLMKDFPAATLAKWDIEAKSADSFLLDLLGLDDRIVYACVQQIAESRRHPPESADDVLSHMERSGLRRTAGALRLGPGTFPRWRTTRTSSDGSSSAEAVRARLAA